MAETNQTTKKDPKNLVLTSYDDVINCVRTLPMTWCPAVLEELVIRADSLPLFNEGKLIEFVSEALEKSRQQKAIANEQRTVQDEARIEDRV